GQQPVRQVGGRRDQRRRRVLAPAVRVPPRAEARPPRPGEGADRDRSTRLGGPMAVNSWSQVAPIGPYNAAIDQIPVQTRRDWFLQRLSRNSLPFFRSNTRAVKNLENRTGVLV